MNQTLLVVLTAWWAACASVGAAGYVVAQNDSRASDDGPGSSDSPWKTMAKAANVVTAGDTVVVRGGIYRESVVVKTSGTAQQPIRFTAAPGERVVLTGADRLKHWTRSNTDRPIYSVEWPHKFIGWQKTMTHPSDNYHAVIGRCEQVFVSGYALRQVLSREQLAPGAFFADVEHKQLFVWDSANRDVNKLEVEASTRPEIFHAKGDHVELRGFRFRYAANAAQQGAVLLSGQHDVMEDCLIEKTNGSGADFSGQDIVVRRCAFRQNGQLGFAANRAHRLLFAECAVEENNVKNFSRNWEAGGDKLCLCRGAVIETSRFLRNRGSGIWFDIGNEQCEVRNCLIADNEDAGIFCEISYRLRAHDNVIVGNGFASTPGAWGAQAAICLSSSPYCLVERNLMVGNREGFNFREQLRTTPTVDNDAEQPVWNHDENVRNNIIAWNRDAQVRGWFDVDDDRHWPANHPRAKGRAGAKRERPSADLADEYRARKNTNQPRDLTLEKLKLSFENNVYFAAAGQNFWVWGTGWHEHASYDMVEDLQKALGMERGGRVFAPKFADLLSFDFRLSQIEATALGNCLPQGAVPGAKLGVLPP